MDVRVVASQPMESFSVTMSPSVVVRPRTARVTARS
jgi:hypothetical protein